MGGRRAHCENLDTCERERVWCGVLSFFCSLEYEGDSGVCKLVFVTFDVWVFMCDFYV